MMAPLHADDPQPGWSQLNVAIVGGGIGGIAVAIALRRAGHKTTIYERSDFAGEVGASVSCAANGTRWLHEWGVDIQKGDPVVLQKLINRDWKTGEPISVYDLSDYEEKWGYVYNMFHRQDMHAMLMDTAVSEGGGGVPAKLIVNHKCASIDFDTGVITFENGNVAQHDLIVGADGIGSVVRKLIGINPEKRPAPSSCLHANVSADEAVKMGLINYGEDSALEYWGGRDGYDKIVLSPCNGGKLLSYYCFFPREAGDYSSHNWNEAATLKELLAPYPTLDRHVFNHLKIGKEIRPWRLWLHDEYPYWIKRQTCLLGDAAHPMMPHQSQGACMAIEDSAALGIIFGKRYFRGNIEEALEIYQRVRKPRATRVQDASLRATTNINERIGFSSNTTNSLYKIADEKNKLTIEEMNLYDMHLDVADKFAELRGTANKHAHNNTRRQRGTTADLSPNSSPRVGRPAGRNEQDSAQCTSAPDTYRLSQTPSRPEEEQPMQSLNLQGQIDVNACPQDKTPQHVPLETPELQYEPRSRMLRNLRGEQVYIGGAASISFLQLIRDTVTEHIGPSQFSHNNKSDNMLETESPKEYRQAPFSPVTDPDVDLKLLYAQTYQAATGGYLDVLSASEVEELLMESSNPNSEMTPCRRATADLIVAIGAQCSKATPISQQIERSFSCRAQQNAFSGMLEDPNIDMVRAFTLMAFYMLGACRRNAAWMYLGVATRAAAVVGLHRRDSYAATDNPKYRSRLRIWMSLSILDLLVSSILGRPSATSSLRTDLNCNFIDNSQTHNDPASACLLASYNIRPIINEIVEELYEKKMVSTIVAKRLLEDIEKWSRGLPDSLRRSVASSSSRAQKHTIGNIHVSCLYYFAVTLVTRPFLISTLITRPTHPQQAMSPPSTQEDSDHTHLASACLDAAVYLIQTCTEAYKSDILLSNMCILKALVFAAALILGFDMFSKREVDHEIESAFSGAREILDMLSAQSPQAAHYFEILTMLSNAIAKQRKQLASRGRSNYVGRLFTLDGANAAQDQGRAQPTASTSLEMQPGQTELDDQGVNWTLGGQMIQPDLDEGLLLRWDSLDLPLWDSFPFMNARNFDTS
ncbi:hypothetical protein FQN54_007396 [Arachnomyces sp. PD_36]|nr:hypothetical protein FQN54_007396 [Arachnomyces sp. PD_36]